LEFTTSAGVEGGRGFGRRTANGGAARDSSRGKKLYPYDYSQASSEPIVRKDIFSDLKNFTFNIFQSFSLDTACGNAREAQ